MINRPWAEENRTFFICVDSYRQGVMQGRIYNPQLNEGRYFQSLTGFLLEMEQVLDEMDFPKAYTTTRTFRKPLEKPNEPPGPVYPEGDSATFSVRILFRQNASWQGSVTWLDEKQEQSFRSVLELILLFDNALTQKHAS